MPEQEHKELVLSGTSPKLILKEAIEASRSLKSLYAILDTTRPPWPAIKPPTYLAVALVLPHLYYPQL